MKKKPPEDATPTELEDLRTRLAEAQAVLNAIRNGEVDALMVTDRDGEQVHTISGAYRHLIETMSEGAATLSADGAVLYCNSRLTEMLGVPHDQLLGTRLQNYLQPADRQMLDALLAKAHTKPVREEINLKTGDGYLMPVYLSAARLLNQENEPFFNFIITDLTEKKQHEKIVEAERLARLILEQAEEAIIVCDEQGKIIRISQAARQFCNENPLASPFAEMFPLQTGTLEPLLLDSILKGKSLRNVDVTLKLNGQIHTLILNAGPLASGKEILGCVILLTDISERRRTDIYRDISREILQILNEPGEMQDAVPRILTVLKTKTGFDAVGLRLKNGDDFPYLAQRGFPDDFLLTENSLIGRNREGGICRNPDGTVCLECTCGLILSGKTDLSNPLFTQGGSFWTNDSFPLLELSAGEDPRSNPRNECIHHGYASVALIPVKTKEGIIGLIQLNDRRKGCFSLATIELMESIALHIGVVLMRKQTEEQIERIARFPQENPSPVLRVSAQGILEYANVAAHLLLPALGVAQIGDKVNVEWQHRIKDAITAKKPIDIEFQWQEQAFEATLSPALPHNYVNLYIRDITARKQAEKILQTHNEEQERFNRAAVGRELRMIELKEEINDLRRQLGQPARYAIHVAEPERALPELQRKGWLKNLFGGGRSHES